MSEHLSDLKAHPLAEQFPLMTDDQLKELAVDLKEHGMDNPIVLLDGQILDGRNRYNALKSIDHQFSDSDFIQFEDLKSEGDPERYVISANIMRRQLTPGQRAAWGEEYYEKYLKKKAGNPELVKSHGGLGPKEQTELQHGQKDVGSNAPRIGEHRDEQEVSTSRVAKTRERRQEAAELHGATVSAMEDYAHLKKTDPQAAADQKAGKPPKQTAPRKFSAKVRKAIGKIGQVCGQDIRRAFEDGTLDRISDRDIIRWSEEPEPVMKRLVYYVIDNGWNFDEARRYDKEQAVRELSPEEIKCKELLEKVTRLCCAQVLEAFERRNSVEAKQALTTKLYEVVPPILPYEPKAGVSVNISLDEKDAAPEAKPSVTLPRGWAPEVEHACEKIGKECGASVAQALKDGAVKMPHQDIIRWSRFNPRTMKDLVPHIKQGCSLDEAIQREENRITNTFSYLTKQKSP